MDVYIRVSRVGERDEEEATEAYEAGCRDWARRAEVDVGEVVEDTDVSGSVAVAERGLERLIQRVESGESAGIITPYLDRFGRSVIEGALAYKRIADAGGRLVCHRDGLDSDREGDKLQFNVRMAFAEDYLDRVRANWNTANDRAVAQGWWIAPRVPFGYRKDEDRHLVVVEPEAEIVRELYARRAGGENVLSLMRWMRGRCAELGLRNANVTRSGVRSVLRSEAYLGKTRYARGRRDNPIVKRTHAPILTEAQWEGAQVKHPFSPRTGRAANARLRGLVFCATCGRRCKVGMYGPPDRRRTTYVCTREDCDARPSILTAKLDGHVEVTLMQAAADHEPNVEAILLGDTRYQDAVRAVEDAKRDLDEFRDNVEVQRLLGIDEFAKGIEARKEAVLLARREMSRLRPTAAAPPAVGAGGTMTREAIEAAIAADTNARFVERVVLRPAGGKQLPASERSEVYVIGAAEPLASPV